MASYKIKCASIDDMQAVADIFSECFRDSVLFYCGKQPYRQAMQDIFTLVFEAEPQGVFVAKHQSRTVGYCFCPSDISKTYVTAVKRGYIFKFAWRYFTGCYGIGLQPLKMLFLNKVSFLKSALDRKHKCSARILSVAVLPEFQGRGIATMLMRAALNYFFEQQTEKVRLEVRPWNLPAIKVYEKMGFQTAGKSSDPQGEWLIMFRKMR